MAGLQMVTLTTDVNGDGWALTGIAWADFRAATHQGSDPAPTADDRYWPGEVHVQERTGKVLVSVTGAPPSTTTRVYVATA
jgi:hypothetical protein